MSQAPTLGEISQPVGQLHHQPPRHRSLCPSRSRPQRLKTDSQIVTIGYYEAAQLGQVSPIPCFRKDVCPHVCHYRRGDLQWHEVAEGRGWIEMDEPAVDEYGRMLVLTGCDGLYMMCRMQNASCCDFESTLLIGSMTTDVGSSVDDGGCLT